MTTANPEYLMVKNWHLHQHYKDRSPPWIKLYKGLLEDYEFARLADAAKGHLMLVWILASIHDNKIPNDPRWVAGKIGATEPVDLDALVSAGFLTPYQDASKTLADCQQDAMPREDIEPYKPEDREQRTEETQHLNFMEYESGDRNLIPKNGTPRDIRALAAALGDSVAKIEAEELNDTAAFLHGFFPPTRPGAGPNPAVVRWTGRIPEHRLRAAIRDMRARRFRNGTGPELGWGQLAEEDCKRVILAELNTILKTECA